MQQLRATVRDQVGVITLDNPPDQFMTTRMVAELDELTAEWEVDDGVRAIVVTGAKPGTFITHFSVEELERAARALPPDGLPAAAELALQAVVRGAEAAQRVLALMPSTRRSLERKAPPPLRSLLQLGQIHRVFARLERMDKVVVAAINGTAMGGGCELALACDYRLMARGDHVIGLIEVLGGIVPGAGGTQRLPMTVGRAKALEMVLDGAVLSADEAERVGLITRAVDAEHLMREALELAGRMANRPLTAVGHAKRAIRVGAGLPLDEGLAFERLAMAVLGTTSDAQRLGAHYLKRFRAGRSARQIFDELRAHGVRAVAN
jgi:enoyl-CoA hydratase/carnithine racemase